MKEEDNKQNETLENNFEEVQIYQEVETKKKEVRTDSYFDGGVLELIGWKILALLITGVTFGIARPWAKCMLYSWQLKHTVYNGKRLKFEGTGGDLFVNMFKWIFFTIITLGIYAFFIPIKKAKWVISNIHFEDEEYVKEESFFDGKVLQLIGINILSRIITVFSLGLLYPFAVCLKLKWINKHTVINRKKIVFDGNGLQLWGKYLLWYFLTLITFGIFSFWIPVLMLKLQTKHTHIKTVGEVEKKDKTVLFLIPIAVILVVALVVVLTGNIFTTIVGSDLGDITSELFENSGFVKKDSSAGGRYEKLKKRYLNGKISAEEFIEEVSTQMYFDEIFSEDDPNFVQAVLNEIAINGYESKTIQESVPVKTETTKEPAKTSISVGGYTLKFGTYAGTIQQGVWDEETMTSSVRNINVTLKLTEDSITLDGRTAGYTVSGNELKWKGSDYKILEVTGNNKIRYLVETCPELTYQGN